MVRFLRGFVKTPGESVEKGNRIARAKTEMGKLGFNKIDINPQGNLPGYMGFGEKLITFDGYTDTVGIGETSSWKLDPYNGYETETEIGGRGIPDRESGVVSAIYDAKIMKDLGLLSEKYTALITIIIQEEDCDGLCWQYTVEEDGIRSEFVISVEPTDGGICCGQRSQTEIKVDVKGTLCHDSTPEHGDSATYKTADILQDIRALNSDGDTESTATRGLVHMLGPRYSPEWQEAHFLSRDTVTVSQIFRPSPSRRAVADGYTVSPDRRATAGETWESCLEETYNLPAVKKCGDDVVVSIYNYDRPSYTDLIYETECYFLTRVIPENHDVAKALMKTHKNLYGEIRKGFIETPEMREERPLLDKWAFSTNGVSIMRRDGIPYIGFGPGAEAQAYAPNERTWKDDLVCCAVVYTALSTVYCG